MSGAASLDAQLQLCRLLTRDSQSSASAPIDQQHFLGEEFWIDFTELADNNLVTSAVWPALLSADLVSITPADFQDYFRAAFEWNVARNKAIENELARAIAALNGRAIVPILLKGAAYIKERIYPEIGARILGDLDILIEEDDLDAAVEVFVSLGYQPAGRPGRDYRHHHHVEPLKHADRQAYVELHREAIAEPLTSILPAKKIVLDYQIRKEGSLTYAVPSPTHAATISFLHSQIIDRCNATARVNVRSVMDISLLNAKYARAIDWNDILANVTIHGLEKPLRNYIFALERLTGLVIEACSSNGIGQRFHYCLVKATLRFPAMQKIIGFLDELSVGRIADRYNTGRDFKSVSAARLKHTAFVVKRLFQRGHDDTP